MTAQQTPVWFIVGASSGFGHSIALSALSAHHRVIATSRSPSSSSTMLELQNLGAKILAIDVTWSEEVLKQKIEEDVVGAYGYITHVVNAGGYALGGVNEAIGDDLALRQFQVNVLGTMKVTRLVTPHLRSQSSGTIINFGSVGSWVGVASMSHYAASKWAVSGFSESMALELAPLGIKVMVVEPGYFRTNFLSKDHVIWAEDRMEEVYGGTAADEYRDQAAAYDGNQLGDVEKAGKVIVDVVMARRVAEGKDVPVRLVLGSDCLTLVKKKCEDTLNLLEEWKAVSLSTDHDN